MTTEDGYKGVDVRMTQRTRMQIIILVTNTQNIFGDRIRELTTLIQEQFNIPEGTVEVTWQLAIAIT